MEQENKELPVQCSYFPSLYEERNNIVYQNYQLCNDDCMRFLKKLPDGSVDMVLVDPPFAISVASWDTHLIWDEVWGN